MESSFCGAGGGFIVSHGMADVLVLWMLLKRVLQAWGRGAEEEAWWPIFVGSLPEKRVEKVVKCAVQSPVSLVLCHVAQVVSKVLMGRQGLVGDPKSSTRSIFYHDQDRFW